MVAWSSAVDPACLMVEARPCKPTKGFDIERFGAAASVIINAEGNEHITVNTGRMCWRVDVLKGSVLSGPAQLNIVLGDVHDAPRHLRALQQLLTVHDSPAKMAALHSPKSNHRIVSALRVYDALSDGASYRAIAIALFGERRVKEEWSAMSDSMRLQIRRLAKHARQLAGGGWKTLLQ
jgi:hypothetical protein